MAPVQTTHELAVDTGCCDGDNAELSTDVVDRALSPVDGWGYPCTPQYGLYAATTRRCPQSTALITTITLIHHHLVGKVAT